MRTTDDAGSAWSSRRSRIGAIAVFAIAIALFYFVPGLPDSPHGTHVHHLVDAVAEAALVTAIGGLMLRFVVLPTR